MAKQNMEGWEVAYADLYKSILKMKQGDILAKAKFTSNYTVPKDVESYMREHFGQLEEDQAFSENQVKQLICNELAKNIYETKEIHKEDRGFVFAYKLELIVLNMGEMKHIIDYIIKSLTLEQIERIKNEVEIPPQQ